MKLQALFTWMLRTSLAIAVGAMLFIPRPLLAQVDTGSILGTITDASGAVIGGATVTLTNEGTSATLSTTAESDGSYKFTPVRIGTLHGHATSSQGFQTTEQKNIVVNVGIVVVVNFVLKPGQVTETVEVTTTTPVLETQRRLRRPGGQLAQRQQSPPERPELHLPGPAVRRRELPAGRHARQRGAAAPLPPTVSGRRRTTTCWMELTTTPTRSTS